MTDPKPPAKPQKELLPAQSSAQESKPAQPKTQTIQERGIEGEKDNGEEGTEKEKRVRARKAVILADSDGQTRVAGRSPLVSV